MTCGKTDRKSLQEGATTGLGICVFRLIGMGNKGNRSLDWGGSLDCVVLYWGSLDLTRGHVGVDKGKAAHRLMLLLPSDLQEHVLDASGAGPTVHQPPSLSLSVYMYIYKGRHSHLLYAWHWVKTRIRWLTNWKFKLHCVESPSFDPSPHDLFLSQH